MNVDRKSRALGLSIKAKDIDDEQEAVASLKEQDEVSSPGTIGDLIKAKMEDQCVGLKTMRPAFAGLFFCAQKHRR